MVDKIGKNYDQNWIEEINQPNKELQELIEQRCADLLRKFKEIDFEPHSHIICSALKNYNLNELLSAIKN